jgi:hypothetical protein
MVQTTIPAEAVNAFCASEGVTVSSFMQAAFAETMSRLTRETKGLSLTVSNGRSAGMELLSCVGMFVKTIPVVRPTVEKDTTASDFIKAVHGQLQQSYEKEFYPYTRLVERHRFRPEIMMIYQGGIREGGDIDGMGLASCAHVMGLRHFTMADTTFRNGKDVGLQFGDPNLPRAIEGGYEIVANNLYFICDKPGLAGNVGLLTYIGDSHFTDIVVVDYTTGIRDMKWSNRYTRCHIWGGIVKKAGTDKP